MNTFIAEIQESTHRWTDTSSSDDRDDPRATDELPPSIQRRAPRTTGRAEAAARATGGGRDSTGGGRDSTDGGRDAYGLYLREACRYKLLTAAEEIVLGRRVRRGDAEAREQMILSNLRLVVRIARTYENSGLPLLDLINEGNMGLMKAVERFDPERGNRFSTYAAFWIKQCIRSALMNQSRTVRLPVHLFAKSFRLQQVAARLQSEMERAPSTDELAAEMGISIAQTERLQDAHLTFMSLDAPLSDGNEANFASQLADEGALQPSEHAERRSRLAALEAALGSLSPRERDVLCERFGLGDREARKLKDIGHDVGLTRERIRQIQFTALRKLRRRFEQAEQVEAGRLQFSRFKYLLAAGTVPAE